MQNPSYFAILPADVRYDAELTPLEKILYAEISALTNERGYCWAGNQYFARLYGKNENYISSVINRLGKKGYINIETEKGGKKAGSERVLSLPKKYTIPPHPTSEKPEVAKKNLIATSEKPEVDTLYKFNNIKKKNCSFLQNEPLVHFSEIWKKYPLRTSRKEAFKYFKNSVKNDQDWQDIQKALSNYIKHLSQPSNKWKQPQAGKTWFNNWHDWVEWQEPMLAEEKQKLEERITWLRKAIANRLNLIQQYTDNGDTENIVEFQDEVEKFKTEKKQLEEKLSCGRGQ
ncbi:MAG: helix-turn-helix domain-containing protein [Nitrospirae bacterium]|nr:MAG: helix-turn-helix domain-containing protein [Nitrospirota bacterium]